MIKKILFRLIFGKPIKGEKVNKIPNFKTTYPKEMPENFNQWSIHIFNNELKYKRNVG